MKEPQQNPCKFLDTLIKHLGLKNDAGLARALGMGPPVISKIRHGKHGIGATLLLRAHELTELPTREIRTWYEVQI